MKNILFKIVVIVVFYFISVNDTISCPTGFTQYSIDRRYIYSQNPYLFCDVTIFFCCKWDNSIKEVAIEFDHIENTNTQDCMSFIMADSLLKKDFFDWVELQMVNYADSVCSPPYPPCDDIIPYYTFKIFKPRCGKFKNLIRYTGDPVYSLTWYPCYSHINCVSIYRICTDYSVEPPRIVVQYIGTDFFGIPECSTELPQMPPVGKTWDEPWETECFKVNCVDYP